MPKRSGCVTAEFLAEHRIGLIVHGDDISPEAVEKVYGDRGGHPSSSSLPSPR